MLRDGGSLYVQEPVAAGSSFELLRPIDNETRVRGDAQDAIRRAAQGSFTSLASREIVMTVRYADFDALRAHMVSVDPARGVALDLHEGAVREAFEGLGRPVEGGYEFEQPLLIELLSRQRRGRVAVAAT